MSIPALPSGPFQVPYNLLPSEQEAIKHEVEIASAELMHIDSGSRYFGCVHQVSAVLRDTFLAIETSRNDTPEGKSVFLSNIHANELLHQIHPTARKCAQEALKQESEERVKQYQKNLEKKPHPASTVSQLVSGPSQDLWDRFKATAEQLHGSR